MTFSFRPAKRENVQLLIGLAGGTGSGKTFSAFELATGIAEVMGGKPAVIDTEARRALHYADRFDFEHGDLQAPFTPARYLEAMEAAAAAGYPVILVDSMSHEYAGDGGILDMQEAEFQRMGGRDSVKMASWIKPKMEHKAFVQRLLQIRAHLILCFRAEPKVDMVKENGKTVIVPKQTLTGLDGWVPVTEKNLPFELTASFLLHAETPGVPRPIKLQEQHRALFPAGQPITRESGRMVARWARGEDIAPASTGAKRAPKVDDEAALATALSKLAIAGVTREAVIEHLEHAPTVSDLPELRKLYATATASKAPAAPPPAAASQSAPPADEGRHF